MRYVYRILGFCLFLLALGFAFKNNQLVSLQYYLGLEWHAPLVLVLFITFCTGALGGILACLSLVITHRRRLLALQKELNKLQPTAD